jgi:hypothetical protein
MFHRTFDHCFSHGQYRQALGIVIETRRLDVSKRAVASGKQTYVEICGFLYQVGKLTRHLYQSLAGSLKGPDVANGVPRGTACQPEMVGLLVLMHLALSHIPVPLPRLQGQGRDRA